MAHRILIADDDQEFSLLLKDVFTQADYEVETCGEVASALQRVEKGDIDLVVTDFRMPGENGMDLVRGLRVIDPRMPVIMVSGYLENGIIRELIGMGVGGVFIKPLNILQLLKKTQELIEHEAARKAESEGTPESGFGAQVGFVFRSFPCRDARSRDFAKRLFDLKDFSRNLLLIAGKGTDIRTICEDLAAASDQGRDLVVFHPQGFDESQAIAALRAAESPEGTGVTCMVTQAEQLSPEQRLLLYRIARREGIFGEIALFRRFIFCLERELDEYYDQGLIDEELYLFLGATELKVPGLRDIPEDLAIIADTLVARESPDKQLEAATRSFLSRHPWEGNVEELRDLLRGAARIAPGTMISVDHLRKAVELPSSPVMEDANGLSTSPLENFLQTRRGDYLQAFQRMTGLLPPKGSAPKVRFTSTHA